MKSFVDSFSIRDRHSFHHLLIVCLFLSLIFHLLLALGLKRVAFTPPGRVITEPPEKAVRLEFVDSPERIAPLEEEPKKTNLISNKSSRAQDMIPGRKKESQIPRAVGRGKEKSIRLRAAGAPETFRETASSRRPAEEKTAGGKIPPARRRNPARGQKENLPAQLYTGEGRDKFSSPEADHPEGKAALLKQVAYNVRSTAVGEYLTRIKPRVINLWHFNIMKNTFFIRSERTSILFKIMPDGRLGRIKLNKHQGPDIEMGYGLNAIENSAPFPPLTKEIRDYIKDDGLWLEFTFIYK